MAEAVQQTIENWGNSLGLRVPAAMAKAVHIARGTVVSVEVAEGGLLVRVLGRPRRGLAEKLRAFDPRVHGGEVMASTPVGDEAFDRDKA